MLTYVRGSKDKYILRGETKKVRLTQGMVTASRILKPVVIVEDNSLLAGSEVYESIEAKDTIGTLFIQCGGDIPLAYRVANLTTCFADALNVGKWTDTREWAMLCLSPSGQSADEVAKMPGYHKQACAHLGLAESVIPTVRKKMLAQADFEELCRLLRDHDVRFSTAAIETEIRAGTLAFTPALAEFGVVDPAVTDRKKKHTEAVCQPLTPRILHMQHLLCTSPHAYDQIRSLIGVAIRKGFQPHLAVGLAFYQHGLSMQVSARSVFAPILGMLFDSMMVRVLTPASFSPLQIASALAVVFSEAGSLDDQLRQLNAALPDWDKKTEKVPA